MYIPLQGEADDYRIAFLNVNPSTAREIFCKVLNAFGISLLSLHYSLCAETEMLMLLFYSVKLFMYFLRRITVDTPIHYTHGSYMAGMGQGGGGTWGTVLMGATVQNMKYQEFLNIPLPYVCTPNHSIKTLPPIQEL